MRELEDVSQQLVTLVRGLRQLHETIVAGSGHQIEVSAVGVLARLDLLGPSRLSGLADALCLDLSTVSRQVPALERQGWVVRTRDPEDHRAQLIELTPAGRTMLGTVRASRTRILQRLLPEWDAGDLRAFAAQLARFNHDITHNRSAVLPATAGTEST